MHPAARGVAQQEDREQGIDQQDIVDGVVLVLAALTRGLVRRGLGADDAPCGPVRGTRGEAGAAAGMGATGVEASSGGTTTVAASASAIPRRWARATRERAGAAPRGRRAQYGPQDRAPRMGCALAPAAYAPVPHLEGGGLEGDQDAQEPVCRCREGAACVDGKPARRARLPSHAPGRHPGGERGLARRDELRQRGERHAGAIQERQRAGL